MTIYPVIIPTSGNNNNNSSNVQECMERKANSDILKKYLAQEELNEDDISRISECVDEKDSTEHITAATVIGFLAILLIAITIMVIGCIFF